MMKEKMLILAIVGLMIIGSLGAVGIRVVTKRDTKMISSEHVKSLGQDDMGFVPGEVIVNFYPKSEHFRLKSLGVATVDACEIKDFNGYDVVDTIPSLNSAVIEVEADTEEDLWDFITSIENDDRVKYAEPNYIYRTCVDPPDDPFWDYIDDPSWSQWGPKRIHCLDGWDTATGDGVTIAIIDTGVDCDHVDLTDNVCSGKDFVNINFDDYGAEYEFGNDTVDWYDDYVDIDDDPDDAEGHGTHCAGIAAAVTDNSIGIAGVARDANIMPVRAGFRVKYYDPQTGWGFVGIFERDDIAKAITYAADNDADVISMSFGSRSANQTISDACQYAWDNGCILVAAAGNGGDDGIGDDLDSTPHYPSGYDTVISAGAINKNDDRCGFSNYGGDRDDGTGLEIMAPGDDITSTYPDDYIAILSGTSMACPHVAGVTALAIDKNPSMNNDKIRQLLRDSAEDIAHDSDFDNYYGFGLVDAKLVVPESMGNVNVTINRIEMLDEIDYGGGADLAYIIGIGSNYILEVNDENNETWEPGIKHIFEVDTQIITIMIEVFDYDYVEDWDEDIADISNERNVDCDPGYFGDKMLEGRVLVVEYDLLTENSVTIISTGEEREEEGNDGNGNSGPGESSAHEDDAWIKVTIEDDYNPNNPPTIPDTPWCDDETTEWYKNTGYTFKTRATDPNGDLLRYGWDWSEDDINAEWETECIHESGITACSTPHVWSNVGTYTVRVMAEDEHGARSEFSPELTINVVNRAPEKPNAPSGPDGAAGTEYTYMASTTDPDGDQVYYKFDWGDGYYSEWVGPYSSGEEASASHKWTSQGNVEIKVKAKDEWGGESPWSDPLSISMPKSKDIKKSGVVIRNNVLRETKMILLNNNIMSRPVANMLLRLAERFPALEFIFSLFLYQ